MCSLPCSMSSSTRLVTKALSHYTGIYRPDYYDTMARGNPFPLWFGTLLHTRVAQFKARAAFDVGAEVNDLIYYSCLLCRSLTARVFRLQGSEFQFLAASSSYPSLQAAVPTAAIFTTTLWLVGKLRLFLEDNGRLHYFIIPGALASVRSVDSVATA